MSRTAVLSDVDWARIEPLLPSSDGCAGRPFRDHRQVVEGIVYRYRPGIAWRDLPREFGPWQTVWKRHHRFCRDGTWDRLVTRLQARADAAGELDWQVSVDSTVVRVHQHGATARRSRSGLTSHTGAPPTDKKPQFRQDEPGDHGIGRSRGGLTTKTHAPVDGRGRPLVVVCTPGQRRGLTCPAGPARAAAGAATGRGPPPTTPDLLLGDKAYSARADRAHLRARGVTTVIPEPADQLGHRKNRGSRGGQPVSFDAGRYRDPNVVERAFNQLKNWRGLATRYDKHVLTYRGGVVLAAILLWLTD